MNFNRITFNCPHCGQEQDININFDQAESTGYPTTCDSDQGGCEKPLVIYVKQTFQMTVAPIGEPLPARRKPG